MSIPIARFAPKRFSAVLPSMGWTKTTEAATLKVFDVDRCGAGIKGRVGLLRGALVRA
jgi:hypothetical protein